MALTPKYRREGAPKGRNPSLGKGKMGGSSPKSGGHPVGGKGLKSSKGGTFTGKGRSSTPSKRSSRRSIAYGN